VSELGRDLHAHVAVGGVVAVVAGAEDVGRLVVVARTDDRLLEDRRIRGDAGEAVLAYHPRELAGGQEGSADVVEPDALPERHERADRAGEERGGSGHVVS
jgi:hypothetical protein